MKFTVDKVEPCGYNILVELLEVEEKTEGGIVLTSSTQNREQDAMPIGKVLKTGPLCYKNHESGANGCEDWGYEVGDHVQFPGHTYKRVAGEKSNLVYVLDHDVIGKVQL